MKENIQQGNALDAPIVAPEIFTFDDGLSWLIAGQQKSIALIIFIANNLPVEFSILSFNRSEYRK